MATMQNGSRGRQGDNEEERRRTTGALADHVTEDPGAYGCEVVGLFAEVLTGGLLLLRVRTSSRTRLADARDGLDGRTFSKRVGQAW